MFITARCFQTHTAQIETLFHVTDRDRRDARRGTVAAVALDPAPMPSEPGRTSYTLNGATFRGEIGVGMSVAHRVDTENPFAITAGISYSGGKSTAIKAGIAGEF